MVMQVFSRKYTSEKKKKKKKSKLGGKLPYFVVFGIRCEDKADNYRDYGVMQRDLFYKPCGYWGGDEGRDGGRDGGKQ